MPARFFLPVPVFATRFRALTLRGVHLAGQLKFFGHHTRLAERKAFAADAARTKDGAVVQAVCDPTASRRKATESCK